jgi:short-subunit dehydrogenase
VRIEPGTRVLLTGATGGIGAATARALGARGAQLVLTGRRADVLAPLAAETGAQAVVADLADPASVDALVAAAGDVDVVVANAALPSSGELGSFTVEQLDRALAVNLRAPIALAHAFAGTMAARGSGHFVFVNSLSGKTASPGGSVYSATKFGLRGFALGLRQDLAPAGVGVSTVFPGFIRDAGMFADTGAALPGYVATRSPEDVAGAVIRAVERNRGEVAVAPLSLRAAAAVAGLVPEVVARAQARLGASDIAREMAAAQASKR